MQNSNSFEIVQGMVRNHLKNADRDYGSEEQPGPGPKKAECYAAAIATAAGAFASRGITVSQWSQLDKEVRGHRDSAR